MHSLISSSEEIAIKKNHIEKYLKVVERKAQADQDKKYYIRAFKQAEERFLTGETVSLAAVEVQNILNDIANLSSIKFTSMRVMKPQETENEDFMKIPVQFSMKSDVIQLKEIIYQIEKSKKLLTITEIDARLSRSRKKKLIRSTITVAGIMIPPRDKG